MIYDVIIIGSGPAGYTAGIYTSRAKLKTLMFAGLQSGGQLMYTTEVENYPGITKGTTGPKLMIQMREQMLSFGAKIFDEKVTKVNFGRKPFQVYVDKKEYVAKSVIIATGASSVTLGLEKEKELTGKGISVCAVCDAAFFKDKEVYVVGGGDSAIEDSLALTKFTATVNLVVRKDFLRASKIMQDRILKNPQVKILFNHEVKKILGDNILSGLKLLNNKNNQTFEVSAQGLFFAIGHRPSSEVFKNSLKLNIKGYILNSLNGVTENENMAETWLNKYPTMTSIPGIFAAGDVVDFHYRQAIIAAGTGSMAALDAEKWLNNQ